MAGAATAVAYMTHQVEAMIRPRPRDCIFAACARGDKDELTEQLRPMGYVETDEELAHGLRLLHVAAYFGRAAIVEMLRARNAADTRAAAGLRWWTACHIAAARGHADCLRALHPSWDECQRRDSYNRSPVHLAAAGGHVKCLEELLKRAPDERSRAKALNAEGHVTKLDEFGHTPLDEACEGRHWDCVRFLVARGATLVHTERCLNEAVAEARSNAAAASTSSSCPRGDDPADGPTGSSSSSSAGGSSPKETVDASVNGDAARSKRARDDDGADGDAARKPQWDALHHGSRRHEGTAAKDGAADIDTSNEATGRRPATDAAVPAQQQQHTASEAAAGAMLAAAAAAKEQPCDALNPQHGGVLRDILETRGAIPPKGVSSLTATHLLPVAVADSDLAKELEAWKAKCVRRVP